MPGIRPIKLIAHDWGQQCMYCEAEMFFPDDGGVDGFAHRAGITVSMALRRRASREHLHRRADGGSNKKENLGLACTWCNNFRERATIVEHRQAMMALAAAGKHPCHSDIPMSQPKLKQALKAGKREQVRVKKKKPKHPLASLWGG